MGNWHDGQIRNCFSTAQLTLFNGDPPTAIVTFTSTTRHYNFAITFWDFFVGPDGFGHEKWFDLWWNWSKPTGAFYIRSDPNGRGFNHYVRAKMKPDDGSMSGILYNSS